MTEAVIEHWNSWDDGTRLRETLGMHMLEADDQHVLFEVRETDFNKAWGYFAGFALSAILEHAPAILANYSEYSADPEAAPLAWLMTTVTTNFLSNTRANRVLCESQWVVRGKAQSIVSTQIRDGDRVLVQATSTHTKR